MYKSQDKHVKEHFEISESKKNEEKEEEERRKLFENIFTFNVVLYSLVCSVKRFNTE